MGRYSQNLRNSSSTCDTRATSRLSRLASVRAHVDVRNGYDMARGVRGAPRRPRLNESIWPENSSSCANRVPRPRLKTLMMTEFPRKIPMAPVGLLCWSPRWRIRLCLSLSDLWFRIPQSAYYWPKFVGTFSVHRLTSRKARERELATLYEKLTSSVIAER